jgi:hypothetical protein
MIGDLLKIVASALGIAGPIIAENRAQKLHEDEQKRIAEYQDILQINDPEDKRNRLGGFAMRLCLDAGTPAGKLSGTSIEVPMECFHALIRIAIENEKQDKMLASFIEALKSK